MLKVLEEWLTQQGMLADWAQTIAPAVSIVGILLAGWIGYFLARRPFLALISRIVGKTSSKIDDYMMQSGFFRRLTLLVPGLIIYALSPTGLRSLPAAVAFIQNLMLIYLTVAVFLSLDALLSAVNQTYEDQPVSNQIPIKSFLQGIKIVLVTVSFILIIAIILGKTPFYLLSGLGALTAVLMLIFKDAILGFVAGIQLAANRMVAKGDWISMPQYGADGFVIDVALTTVKVQNWDKTITTIPTYALINDSFRNWRGMFESGGRRIMRSLNIDISTIKLCTTEMLERYAKIEHIKEYLARKQKEISEYNKEHNIDEASRVNGRRLTNVGTFRAYITAYLRNHPKISREMTFLVRQLEPTEHGLPIQIYVFSTETAWTDYEGIQADIFDHLLAVAPEFDLRIFQNPSGVNVKTAIQTLYNKAD